MTETATMPGTTMVPFHDSAEVTLPETAETKVGLPRVTLQVASGEPRPASS